ncbi:FtsX-like permease family protein [Pedobacter sp. SAFR-022]|uniref:ABC transporter permease n=1 Tax=Pedobacter sp. SAFR-022 TaxID=3436861 RepID=UPI003F80626E
MFKLNLKIALRNLKRNFSVSLINIGGLSVALAAFILIALYVNYETSYDKDNPNYEHIYIVGRDLKDLKTNFTPPPLAELIAQHCPEVELVGKMTPSNLDFAIISDAGRIYLKNTMVMDYNAAKIFNLRPQGGLKKPKGEFERLTYLNEASIRTLFPGKKDNMPELVMMGNKALGITGTIHGSIVPNPHSNIQFDAIAIGNYLGVSEGFGFPNYYTYIQVKPRTDISALQVKIDRLLKEGLIKANVDRASIENETIFLDPLSNLHLKPIAGNDTNYKVVIALFILSILIVVIACINFTNLTIAQANKRAKEVGIKKVLGSYRQMLTVQFLFEIMAQCLVSLILALVLAELFMPAFNNLLGVPLSLWEGAEALYWILPLILVVVTLIAAVYPALILSGFTPAGVLKGHFHTGIQTSWTRKGLLVVQFAIAVIFIAGILIVSKQVSYIQTEDTGFEADQVLLIKNMTMFNKPEVFAPLREKMLKIEGIKSATAANVTPGGTETGSNSYALDGKEALLDFVDVDFDYFETLGIKLKSGRTFSNEYKRDTVNSAIINESAAAKYGILDPVGKTIRGCNIDYKIVGVIKDVKSQGFEAAVQPTIYTMKNPCGNPRLEIMLKVEAGKMAAVIASLKKQWPEINKLDGEDFRYDFLDELYGRLFKKQEQLKSVFFTASMLTVFIAILGLFAFSKIMTSNRSKEIAVRKVLGASDFQVLKLLNSFFLWMLLLANLIAWPFVYILAKTWLDTFAYRIEISIVPFAIAGIISVVLAIITVSLQATKAVQANPAKVLKHE